MKDKLKIGQTYFDNEKRRVKINNIKSAFYDTKFKFVGDNGLCYDEYGIVEFNCCVMNYETTHNYNLIVLNN